MSIIDSFTSFIAPYHCIKCGTEGVILCPPCTRAFLSPARRICMHCRRPTTDNWLCPQCSLESPLRRVWVRTAYNNPAKKLVRQYKFSHTRGISRTLASLMSEALPPLEKTVIITYVPTAASRIRERGYDHAELLAKRLAEHLHLPYAPLLARMGKQRQLGASGSVRRTQLQGAFRPLHEYLINGAQVLLVDDVMTTGSSLEEAAKELRQAGALGVDALVFAQA